MGCIGLTEPDHGSDPGGMTSSMKDDGEYVVLTGAKMWKSNDPFADIAIVWAKDEAGKIKGVIVERDMEDISTPDTHNKWTLRTSAMGEQVSAQVKRTEEKREGNDWVRKGRQ